MPTALSCWAVDPGALGSGSMAVRAGTSKGLGEHGQSIRVKTRGSWRARPQCTHCPSQAERGCSSSPGVAVTPPRHCLGLSLERRAHQLLLKPPALSGASKTAPKGGMGLESVATSADRFRRV